MHASHSPSKVSTCSLVSFANSGNMVITPSAPSQLPVWGHAHIIAAPHMHTVMQTGGYCCTLCAIGGARGGHGSGRDKLTAQIGSLQLRQRAQRWSQGLCSLIDNLIACLESRQSQPPKPTAITQRKPAHTKERRCDHDSKDGVCVPGLHAPPKFNTVSKVSLANSGAKASAPSAQNPLPAWMSATGAQA